MDVVQVQADGFEDPDAGVERQLRQDPIAGRRVGLDDAELSEGAVAGPPTGFAEQILHRSRRCHPWPVRRQVEQHPAAALWLAAHCTRPQQVSRHPSSRPG